jgi:hypothetical protein
MSPKRLFQQFWSFMLPTHTSRNIQQSTGHARRPKWRWLSRFLVFEPQQESIGSILGHTAWASNLFVTQIISRCPHLKRCESHSWTLKLFHLKYLRGPAVFRHSKHQAHITTHCFRSDSRDCIQSALGFCSWAMGSNCTFHAHVLSHVQIEVGRMVPRMPMWLSFYSEYLLLTTHFKALSVG